MAVAELSIRVNVDVLDSLMNLVGELVLTRNQLLQLARGDEESKYTAPITHLNRVTTDLQEGVMKTRMQPINGHRPSGEQPDPQPVIVFSEGRHSMGLMVNAIQDILEERLTIRMQSQRMGVLGTAIVNGKATDIIDTHHYITQASPHWYVREDDQQPRRVLVVDSSLFFRQLVSTSLETENYRVVTGNSAIDAVEFIEHGDRFDVVISEIDIPMMDGFEFAEWHDQLLGVPVNSVQEVLNPQTIARTPKARPEIAGLLNLRGQIVTAVNLRKRTTRSWTSTASRSRSSSSPPTSPSRSWPPPKTPGRWKPSARRRR